MTVTTTAGVPTPTAPATGRGAFEAVKARAIADPAGVYRLAAGVDLEPGDPGWLIGACPIPGHGESLEPLRIEIATGRWKCRSCKASGDATDLHARLAGLGLHDAAGDLVQRLAVAVQTDHKPAATTEAHARKPVGDDNGGEPDPADDNDGDGDETTTTTPKRPPGPPQVGNARAVAWGALRQRAAGVKTLKGLWWAVYHDLAKFIGWGWLTLDEVGGRLLDAVVARGLPEKAATSTVRRGMAAYKRDHKKPPGSPNLTTRPVFCGRLRAGGRCGLASVADPDPDVHGRAPVPGDDWCAYHGREAIGDDRVSRDTCRLWLAAPRCEMRAGGSGCHLLDVTGGCAWETPEHECRLLGRPGPCRRREVGWCALIARSTGECRFKVGDRCMALMPGCELLDDDGRCRLPPTGGRCSKTGPDGRCTVARPGPWCAAEQPDGTCLLDDRPCPVAGLMAALLAVPGGRDIGNDDVFLALGACPWRGPHAPGSPEWQNAIARLAVRCGEDGGADNRKPGEIIPAVPLAAVERVSLVVRPGNRVSAWRGEPVLINAAGDRVCDLGLPAGCIDVETADAVISTSEARALAGLDGHKLVRFVVCEAARLVAPGSRMLPALEYASLGALATAAKVDPDRIRDVLNAGWRLVLWPRAGGEVHGLWTWRKLRGRQGIRLTPSDYLCPGAFGLYPPGPGRRLVPVPRQLPPMVGRCRDFGAQAAMQLALLVELVEDAPAVAERQGFGLDRPRVTRMRDRAALPRELWGPSLDSWLEGGPDAGPVLTQTAEGFYRLGDAYRAEWDFIVAGGRRTSAGKSDRARFGRQGHRGGRVR